MVTAVSLGLSKRHALSFSQYKDIILKHCKRTSELNRFARRISTKLRRKDKRTNTRSRHPTRKNPWKHFRVNTIIKISAPEIIDILKPKRSSATIKFIDDAKAAVKAISKAANRKKIMICLEKTWEINAPSAVYLYAEFDRLVTQHPNVRFSVSYPTRKKRPDGRESKVDPVLNRLGFYELLGKRRRPLQETATVKCWNIASSTKAKMELVQNILVKSAGESIKDERHIYRGLTEAIGNAAEHAYSDKISSPANLQDKRHWFLSSVQDNNLLIFVCDLGHGIPNTLGKTENTKDTNLLEKIFKLVDADESSKSYNKTAKTNDAKRIHAAMLVKETRTKLNYRGKGGADLRAVVDNSKDAKMIVISSRGYYQYQKRGLKTRYKPTILLERNLAIDGTVVGWMIPLAGMKNDENS